MIPVRGYEGHKVAVLGVGRSGRPAIEALRAGGAEVVAWDDSPAAREAAEADGIPLADLTRPRSYEGVKALIVSPGIPHLYPAPHPAHRHRLGRRRRRRQRHRPLLPLLRHPRVGQLRPHADRRRHHRLERQVHHHRPHRPRHAGSRPPDPGRRQHRPRRPRPRPGRRRHGRRPRALLLPDRPRPRAAARHRRLPQPLPRPPRPPRRPRRLLRRQAPPVHPRRPVPRHHRRRRERGPLPRQRHARGRRLRRPGHRHLRHPQAPRRRLDRHRPQGLPRRVAPRPPGRLDRPPPDADPPRRPQPPERLRRLRRRPLARPRPAHHRGRARHLPGPPAPQPARSPPGAASASSTTRKATNADAAEKALASFERIRWIAGGRPKDGRHRRPRAALSPHRQGLPDRRGGRGLRRAPSATTPHVISGTIEAAVAAALAEAEEGDVVLLAPACASFDQFESFEHRGRAFEAAVRAVIGQ